uniref:Putative secreted protein n=1 Tax=Anopheles triannulatus TaxID=58253 RepID=A0A2M4B3M8_9DIPT
MLSTCSTRSSAWITWIGSICSVIRLVRTCAVTPATTCKRTLGSCWAASPGSIRPNRFSLIPIRWCGSIAAMPASSTLSTRMVRSGLARAVSACTSRSGMSTSIRTAATISPVAMIR